MRTSNLEFSRFERSGRRSPWLSGGGGLWPDQTRNYGWPFATHHRHRIQISPWWYDTGPGLRVVAFGSGFWVRATLQTDSCYHVQVHMSQHMIEFPNINTKTCDIKSLRRAMIGIASCSRYLNPIMGEGGSATGKRLGIAQPARVKIKAGRPSSSPHLLSRFLLSNTSESPSILKRKPENLSSLRYRPLRRPHQSNIQLPNFAHC